MTAVCEINVNQAAQIRGVFSGLLTCTPLNAVMDGNSPGRIFVDDLVHPSVGFVWTPWGYYYLSGTTTNDEANRELGQLLVDELIPASIAMGERWPALYPNSEAWAAKLEVLLLGRTLHTVPRRTFDFRLVELVKQDGWRGRIPTGFRVATIAELLAAKSGAALAEEILVTWNDLETFAAKGFGFALLHDNEIASLCYACFVGDGEAEVSVRTEEAYRKQGLATLTTSAFVEACLERDVTPSWECWHDNAASNALARKLGFVHRADVPVYVWEEAVN